MILRETFNKWPPKNISIQIVMISVPSSMQESINKACPYLKMELQKQFKKCTRPRLCNLPMLLSIILVNSTHNYAKGFNTIHYCLLICGVSQIKHVFLLVHICTNVLQGLVRVLQGDLDCNLTTLPIEKFDTHVLAIFLQVTCNLKMALKVCEWFNLALTFGMRCTTTVYKRMRMDYMEI